MAQGPRIGFLFFCCHLKSFNNFCTTTSWNSRAALATTSGWPRTNTETDSMSLGEHSFTMKIQDSASKNKYINDCLQGCSDATGKEAWHTESTLIGSQEQRSSATSSSRDLPPSKPNCRKTAPGKQAKIYGCQGRSRAVSLYRHLLSHLFSWHYILR